MKKTISLLTLSLCLSLHFIAFSQCMRKIAMFEGVYYITPSQEAMFWGVNPLGANKATPTVLRTGSFQNIYLGGKVCFLLDTQGTLWAGGYNGQGAFGIGNTNTYSSYVALSGNYSGMKSLVLDDNYGAMIKADGSLWTWGENTHYQIGDGTNFTRLNPVRIGTATDWKGLYYGAAAVIAQKNNGQLWGWGERLSGILTNNVSISDGGFVKIPSLLSSDTDWAKVAVGTNIALAQKTSGVLWSWGGDDHGGIGRASATASASIRFNPAPINTDTDWKDFSTLSHTSYAVKNNGTLWGWGDNGYGQLGNASGQNSWVPIQIGTDTDWDRVYAGTDFAMAVKTDGRIFTFGGVNYFGQLGNGTFNTTGPEEFYPNMYAINVPGCPYLDKPHFGIDQLLQVVNPFNDSLNLQYAPMDQAELLLYDNTGRLLSRSSLLPSGGTLQIPTESWPQGLYLLQVNSQGKTLGSLKVVK
ncbi:MAG: hypothetical protein CFE24_14345 [Flavobacterium sp. BFFFF2]|nr:MAG: hypothetical protein CFE24_14345 [Flavobacterium sp. BFFFF2]